MTIEGTVVLNGGDTEGLIAYHSGKPRPTKAPEPSTTPPPDSGKGAGEGGSKGTQAPPEAPDEEDEDGLTAAEREGLTAKMRRSIGRKHRAMKEAEERALAKDAEAIRERQRAEAAERQVQELRSKLPPEPDATAPKRENFQTDEEYIDALVEHRINARAAKEAQDAQKRHQEQVVSEAAARLTKASELVSDFEETLRGATVALPPFVIAVIQESEKVAEIAYHLAKHPEKARELASMPPGRAVLALGKLEDKIPAFARASAPAKEPSKDADPASDPAPAPKPKPPTAPAPSKSPDVPVITPIPSTGGDAEVGGTRRTVNDAVSDFDRKNGTNLLRRKRS